MRATQEITESLIRSNITRAVGDVVKIMLGLNAEACPEAVTDTPEQKVVGCVGFIGDINGLIYLYFPLTFARHATRHLLGMTDSELDASGDVTVSDAVGELTNMTVGNFKNSLCDSGFPCMLTIPSVIRGSQISVGSIGAANRFPYSFNCGGHKLVAEILIKTEE